jgi:4-amino-4-deoxy-L-arabinose transferase-like glycosyltransferase
MEDAADSPPGYAQTVTRSASTIYMRVAAGVTAALALFTTFYALGTSPWLTDEPVYRDAGNLYVRHHSFLFNREHPPLGKYLIGISQLIFGRSEWATRLPAALATLATGILLALLVARAIGRLPALVTFAAWTLLPHPYNAFDISRAAYLDTIMVAFMTFAVYAAWRWRDSVSWKWAIAMGVGIGLATATKVTALSITPAVVVLLIDRDRVVQRLRLRQLATGGAVGCLAFLATYAPFGVHGAMRAIAHMIRFQLDHSKRGHRIMVAGHIYRHPPWWAQASWLWDASHITTLVMVASLLLVPLLVRRRISAFLLAITLVPAAAFAFFSPVLLPHWMYIWTPTMAALIGIAIGVSLTRDGAWRIVGLVLAAAIAIPAFQHVRNIASLHPTGYHLIEAQLATIDRPNNIVINYGPPGLANYLYSARVKPGNSNHIDSRRVAAVVIDAKRPSPYAGGATPPVVAVHPKAFRRYSTGTLTVWLRR